MDKKLMNVLYIEYDEKIGVLCDNEYEMVSHVLGTDLTLVERKKEGLLFVLVPLTKNDNIEIHADWLKVDGKRYDSDNFFRKDGCQWIEGGRKALAAVA